MIFGDEAPVILIGNTEITLPRPTNRYVDFLKESENYETWARRKEESEVGFRFAADLYWKTVDAAGLDDIISVVNSLKPIYFRIRSKYFEFLVEKFEKPHFKNQNKYEGAHLVLTGKGLLAQYPDPDKWHMGGFLINRVGITAYVA